MMFGFVKRIIGEMRVAIGRFVEFFCYSSSRM